MANAAVVRQSFHLGDLSRFEEWEKAAPEDRRVVFGRQRRNKIPANLACRAGVVRLVGDGGVRDAKEISLSASSYGGKDEEKEGDGEGESKWFPLERW